MKKAILATALSMALILQPLPAAAEGESLIYGKFLDTSGAPIGNVAFSFTFGDKTYASGKSKTDGTFMVKGAIGRYSFSVSNDIHYRGSCIKTSFGGVFDNAREQFQLVFPKKAKYSLKTTDSKGTGVYGSSWTLRNIRYAAVPNPDFGNPQFTCSYLKGSATSAPIVTSNIEAFEMDWQAMASPAPQQWPSPMITTFYRDSIIGSKSLPVSFPDLAKTDISVVAENLPIFENITQALKMDSSLITIKSKLNEPTYLQGAGVPRQVKVLWRYKLPGNSIWTRWKSGPKVFATADGKVTSSFKLSFHPVKMKPGIKVEYRVIGVDFGSMSELKTLTTK